MIGTRSPAVEGAHAYKDSDLLSSTTDCIQLSSKDENCVTEAIKVLQQTLKKSTVNSGTPTTSTDEATDSGIAVEHLADFSHGLMPGEARYIVYRYLKANDMNIPRALESMTRSTERRKKQSINKMALFPCLIPMKGFDQRSICDELGLPFINNISTSMRCLDAEGRLQLEREQLNDCNVHHEELYANLMTPEGTAMSGPTNRELSDRLSSESSESRSPAASSSVLTADRANGKSTLERDDSAETQRAVESENDHSPSSERRGKGNGSKHSGSMWRSLLSLIPFDRFKSTTRSPNSSISPLQRRSSMATETRRHSRFHSILSLSSGRSDGEEEQLETAGLNEMEFLNTAGAAVPPPETPNTLYADCLNFHGILEPIVAVITKHVPFAFHYWDLEGHPAMYCRLGGMDSKKLMQELFGLTPIDAEPRALAVLFNTYALLVVEQLIRYCNRRNRGSDEGCNALLSPPQRESGEDQDRASSSPLSTGSLGQKKPRVGSCIIVIDCAGLKVRRCLYKPLFVMVRSIVRMNTYHFPELVHHVYVTNCTNVVSWSYLMWRGILAKTTRAKVTFCSKHNTAATLCESISRSFVPQELGGECQCPGGCIPSVAVSFSGANSSPLSRSNLDVQSSPSTQIGESSTDQATQWFGEEALVSRHLLCTAKRLVLKARESRKLSFAMNEGSEIIWEFAVKHRRDVTFSAVFISADNDGAMLSLVPRRRVQNEAGHYICSSIGTAIFEWSNKHSFFSRCQLSLKVYHEDVSVASV
ncbi:CRAL/TRIO domain containing protein, putative [Leishmania shawi]|uniref:CRAL/TRIO domain containing protein n=1 Tax=Leishmania shawi TaxID=5680 RepID=A0ABR3DZ33_9TRYP